RNFSIEHARLYASINNLWLGFVLTDEEKNVILVNKATRNLFKIPTEVKITLAELQTHVRGNLDLPKVVEDSLRDARQYVFKDILIDTTYTNIFISPVIVPRENEPKAIGDVILIEDKTEERLNNR